MPPRSSKMKRFIFGFQRRVWWPKCTPASSSSFMETTATGIPFGSWVETPEGMDGTERARARTAPPSTGSSGEMGCERRIVPARTIRWLRRLGRCQGEGLGEILGKLALDHDLPPAERMREGKCPGVEELPLEPEV